MTPPEFIPFPKLARLSREIIITEKIDGTNAQVFITEDGDIFTGSRNRWITPQSDNYGFAKWVEGNKADILKLGPGRHFGEWWGNGIQRNYGLKEKRWSLFNVRRWCRYNEPPLVIPQENPTLPEKRQEQLPECIGLAPILLKRDTFETSSVEFVLNELRDFGSSAAPGFMDPEGIVVYHSASGFAFKKTIKDDHKPKSA
jgi:hypothetical protein